MFFFISPRKSQETWVVRQADGVVLLRQNRPSLERRPGFEMGNRRDAINKDPRRNLQDAFRDASGNDPPVLPLESPA